MYLFTRTGRLRPGNSRDSVAWAIGVTEKVNKITSLDVGLWTTLVSPGNGSLVWSTFVEDLQSLEDANAKLAVDDIFVSEVDRGAQFADGNVDDEVAQLVSGEVDPSQKPQYVVAVRSELAPGGYGKGIAAGIEIAQRATAIGGVPTSFLVSSTGKYGGVAWISATNTLAELEASEAKVNSDPSFLAYVDEVGPGAFLPGITTQTIYTRIV
ncbi:MAG: hypothetical protein QOD30_2062 [Actinomycetota bacterium]|jgi:hypothetical protein|nr:hypothetical protein [Actinomycetota bacterium]